MKLILLFLQFYIIFTFIYLKAKTISFLHLKIKCTTWEYFLEYWKYWTSGIFLKNSIQKYSWEILKMLHPEYFYIRGTFPKNTPNTVHELLDIIGILEYFWNIEIFQEYWNIKGLFQYSDCILRFHEYWDTPRTLKCTKNIEIYSKNIEIFLEYWVIPRTF